MLCFPKTKHEIHFLSFNITGVKFSVGLKSQARDGKPLFFDNTKANTRYDNIKWDIYVIDKFALQLCATGMILIMTYSLDIQLFQLTLSD